MENKIEPSTLTSSPLPQVSVSPRVNLLKILLFTALGLIVVSGFVFIGIQIGRNQILIQQPVVVQPTIAPIETDQMTITGVIRTSGLSDYERQKLDLTNVIYQLTDFNRIDKQDINGYYLLSSDKTIETFLGTCVQIIGTEPTEWKNKNKSDSYLRTTILLNSISQIDNSKCSPYSVNPSENIAGTEKLTLRGIVSNNNRPAPDINYDYQIKLSKPFLDKNSSSGSPQQVSLVDAVPDTNNVWIELTNNLNHEVEIQGYMEWGYAESKYFKIQ